MVKQKPATHLDRDMNEYRMRTHYGGSANYSRQNPSEYNRVQVVHSNGCCSSKKTENIPSQPVFKQQSPIPPQPNAHERSHLRLDPPDPFYHRSGRIKKNVNRTKKPYQQQHGQNQIHPTRTTRDLRSTNYNYRSAQPAADLRSINYTYQPGQPTITTTEKDSCCTIL